MRRLQPVSLELHIDELVLHGFAPGERQPIEMGVHQELTRLLVERGLSTAILTGTEIDSLDAGSFRLRAGGWAETAGSQIARSVYAATAAAIGSATPPAAGSALPGDARP